MGWEWFPGEPLPEVPVFLALGPRVSLMLLSGPFMSVTHFTLRLCHVTQQEMHFQPLAFESSTTDFYPQATLSSSGATGLASLPGTPFSLTPQHSWGTAGCHAGNSLLRCA